MSSTIRVNPETKTRLREYKKHPRATDDEVLNWILDQLEKEEQPEQWRNTKEREEDC